MKKEQVINELKNELLKMILNDSSKDFINSYYYNDIKYICDTFHEFADSNTSIYYNEQREYYYNHVEECENALVEYGFNLNDLLKECGSLDGVICRVGAIGEYSAIYNELSEDEEEIKKALAIYEAIRLLSNDEIQPEEAQDKIEELIDDLQ